MKENKIRDINSLNVLNNGRKDYSKISGNLPLPNLVELQTKSYEEFKQKGLDEVFKEVFPITNYADTLSIEYVSIEIGEPKYSYLECKTRDLSYEAPMTATLRLNRKQNGLTEGKIFMGNLPLMTNSGTFIINGAERVIVSQLVRSPGAYMKATRDEKTGVYTYGADLIPGRGTWLEFESDQKDILSVRIDRQRKMNAGTILKALGLENDEDILKLFGERDSLKLTLKKNEDICAGAINDLNASQVALIDIFRKLKPGEPVTKEGTINFLTQKFFDDKRYDLGRAGRYKLNIKLGIYNRLKGVFLAENLLSDDGDIRFKKGYQLTEADVQALKDEEFFEKSKRYTKKINVNTDLDDNSNVSILKVYTNEKKDVVANIVGTDLNLIHAPNNIKNRITISDILATFSYFMNIMDGLGSTDDIDHLGNRRIRCVGELIQNQFRMGLTKMSKAVLNKMTISDAEDVTPKKLINIKPLTSSIRDFFASSQLSQFMDQTNPLAELTNKRRLSALGPGGLTRDRASTEVRDVHFSHYGRICPVETPEGQNIGLINNLATYAKINQYGFIETPYRRVVHKEVKGVMKAFVLDGEENSEYLDAIKEFDYVIAEANINLGPDGEMLDEQVIARYRGENIVADVHDVDYVDVSPKQIVSIAAACIPFLENDDTTRALMGANMQRQALPLLRPSAPLVGTGLEHQIAHDAGLAVIAVNDGDVIYSDSTCIKINEGKNVRTYKLQKFERSNQGTCIDQKSIVKIGDHITKGQIIADGPAMRDGDLALGQNVTIAFMTWNGYNYEDAVIMSERLVKDDVYTSIHIEKYEIECRETKLGDEEITRDIPNVGEDAKAYLDERGIIVPGAEVKEGDILVGKVTPKGQTEPTPEEKLLMAIFNEKTKEGKDASLRVPHGGAGIVLDVKVFKRSEGADLSTGVNEVVRVYVVQKRKISEGDKMSGRHGNKGVISRILPVEDMPFLPDGTPIDIMLNPLGVPSRMNIGQILEVHLGMALKKLGYKIATPVFDGITNEEILDLMKKAEMAPDGKTVLYDGRTGERFDERITVGVMYMIKLVHMVDDKLHARATGPYSLVTQQPLGGKAQNGGQRFGEMEVWALEAYGAAHILQEILTIKSDDRVGRRKTYESIIKGQNMPKPGIPEAFKVMVKELQSLALDVKLLDSNGERIDMDALAKEAEKEERKVNSSIRNLTDNSVVDTEENFFTEEDQ